MTKTYMLDNEEDNNVGVLTLTANHINKEDNILVMRTEKSDVVAAITLGPNVKEREI